MENQRRLSRISIHKDCIKNYGFCIFKDSRDGWIWLDVMFGKRTLSIALFK